MLLSHYIEKAESEGIFCDVKAAVPSGITVLPVDLCVILANSLENAIHACSDVPDKARRIILINAHTKNDLLFLEITNPFHREIKIVNNLPVTEKKGHGFGTKSIVMTTEKYNGLWSFETKDSMFYMRVVL